MFPNPHRLVVRGWIRVADVQHMTLDDVDSWCLYLDAVEEAELEASRAPTGGAA